MCDQLRHSSSVLIPYQKSSFFITTNFVCLQVLFSELNISFYWCLSREWHENMVDHRSYAHNLSSCEIKACTLRTHKVASQLPAVLIVQLVEPLNSSVINSAAVNFRARRSSSRASTKHSLAICACVKMWEREDRAKSPSLSLKRRKQSTKGRFLCENS